ncbi:MAG: four helix bundle protein, partial [Clostridia bacterium]|nr:four helix bundle protein [Clostridia bacterium]
MADSIMLDRAKDFAVEIINLCKKIKETKKESVLTNQLIRSGTSIGANIHESKYAHSTADFI